MLSSPRRPVSVCRGAPLLSVIPCVCFCDCLRQFFAEVLRLLFDIRQGAIHFMLDGLLQLRPMAQTVDLISHVV
jgi:hypothetical protein